MLPCVCSVTDHRRRQNVVKTSMTYSAIASCATFLFLPHFDVICDLLLNSRTATWNLFDNKSKSYRLNAMHVGGIVLYEDIPNDTFKEPGWTHQNSVRIHNGVKSVSNGQYCATLKLTAYRFLD